MYFVDYKNNVTTKLDDFVDFYVEGTAVFGNHNNSKTYKLFAGRTAGETIYVFTKISNCLLTESSYAYYEDDYKDFLYRMSN